MGARNQRISTQLSRTNKMTTLKQLTGLSFVAVTLLMSIGCEAVNYTGDGRFVDNGKGAAIDRYVVDLGAVNLKTMASTSFKMKNLPKEGFVVGIELKPLADQRLDPKAFTAVVTISILENGKEIFAREGKLAEWTWSEDRLSKQAFVYGRQSPRTYFEASTSRSYELRFAVKQPDQSNLGYDARLLVKGGGWK